MPSSVHLIYIHIILLLFESAYKSFDLPTQQKIHLYMFPFFIKLHFILFLHFFITSTKKCFECSEAHSYTLQNIFEKKLYFFSLDEIIELVISRIIQANI